MYILGLNAFHGDSSCCLFKDSQLVCAVEEERFTRIKHYAGLPFESIKFCLNDQKIDISDIDYITINRDPKSKVLQKIIYAIKNKFQIVKLFNRVKNIKKIKNLKLEIEKEFNCNDIKAKVCNIEHHTAHIASSVFTSNFTNCNYLSVDGFGDFVSTVAGKFQNGKIFKFDEVLFPHSLGLFYTLITQFLGFKKYGDEYKVMGLSAYGNPKYTNEVESLFLKEGKKLFKLDLKYFLHHSGNVEMTWYNQEPKISDIFSDKVFSLLGNPRQIDEKITQKHMDIASSAQEVYENILFKILNDLYLKNKTENLCLSGGCALNSLANGKISKFTPFKKIYINHSPGDSGGSIGSVLAFLNQGNKKNIYINDNPYLGPKFSNDYIQTLVNSSSEKLENSKVKVKKYEIQDDMLKATAKELSEGKIVGFFQGNMEFGARALGNRSILADPRIKDIRDVLNKKIKNREEFRPFAPSILSEKKVEWFGDEDISPFMSKVIKINSSKANLVPGVVHADQTCRAQIVNKDKNLVFYNLIKYFDKITNVPMVINTSFNENEPIVCKPEEALSCFLRTDMDILVLENYIFKRYR
tara:strand:- start:707 stop:2452 length:1746 start_codon:yes stop_codon:yes gene_type:complete